MNKLLDTKYYEFLGAEARLTKSNKVYLIGSYRNVETQKILRIVYFEAKKKENK